MIERTFRTPGTLLLNLAIPSGSVDVETIDGDETHVTVDCADEGALENAQVELFEHGDGHELSIAAKRRVLLGGLVQITLGGLSVGGGAYRVRVRCPHGADLAVRTTSAEVDARGRFGSGDVKTTSGDIRLGELERSLKLNSVSGSATIARVGGKLTSHLVSGNLRVEDTAASVETKTISGDVRLVVAEGDVQLTTVSGDIEVGVRRGSRLHVDANSVSGTLDSEVPLAESPDAKAAGGPLVDLRAKTVSGDFRVVRA